MIARDGDYVARNYKSMSGREGIAYSADIYFHGQKIGGVRNSGDGGTTDLYFFENRAQHIADFKRLAQPYMMINTVMIHGMKVSAFKGEDELCYAEELLARIDRAKIYKSLKRKYDADTTNTSRNHSFLVVELIEKNRSTEMEVIPQKSVFYVVDNVLQATLLARQEHSEKAFVINENGMIAQNITGK